MKKTKVIIVIFFILIVTFFSGCTQNNNPDSSSDLTPNEDQGSSTETQWVDEGNRVQGWYCDAESIALPSGNYRLFYTASRELSADLEMYSATSSDGLNWTLDDGIRMQQKTFPDVVVLPDGKYRMYYQASVEVDGVMERGICSSISSDTLAWMEEPGVRIPVGLQGTYDTTSVADPATVRLPDGSYYMIYRGESGENKYGKTGPNGDSEPIQYLLSATSSDGLNWTAGNLIFSSDDDVARDQVLGPTLVFMGTQLHLFYFIYTGIQEQISNDSGASWSSKETVFEGVAGRPPCDPSLLYEGNAWRMYYGSFNEDQTKAGIFSARLVVES